MKKIELTQEIVRELLHYVPETGKVYKWVKKKKLWKEAGWLQTKGYIAAMLFGKTYQIHRIIWLYVYGIWPEGEIDHLDGNRSNNRIENLADKSKAENAKNRKTNSNNTTGFPGVYWYKRDQNWMSCIRIDGKLHHLGYFDTAEEAYQAYSSKARENGFTERHIRA